MSHESVIEHLRRRALLPAMSALLLAALLYGGNLNDARTLTDHEAYPAAGARQMVATGNWLVPKVGDHDWLEKPPLLHWLDAISLTVFHEDTEWVVRLPSVIAGLVLVVTISLLATSWFGPGCGFAAGVVQATSYYAFTYARLAEADMLLAATVALATYMFIFYQGIGLKRSGGSGYIIAFWCLVGAASLSKGVGYGSFMALLPAASWLIVCGGRSGWKRMASGASAIGLIPGLCIAMAWPIAMLATQPDFAHQWLMNTLGRAMGETRYNQPWWYYASTIPWQLAPWTPLTLVSLGLAVVGMANRNASPTREVIRFCLLWFVVPVILLSFSDGKHHHYLLPCLPALSLVSCLGLKRTAQAIQAGERWVYGFSLVLLAFAVAMLVFSLRHNSAYVQLRATGIVIAASATCVAILFTWFVNRRRAAPGFGVIVIGVSALVLAIHFKIQPALDGRVQDRQFFDSIDSIVPPDSTVIATGGQFVARPIFLIGRAVQGIWAPEEVICHLPSSGVAYVVATRRYAPLLAKTLSVEEVSASRHSNEETTPLDRWALMRVTTKPGVRVKCQSKRRADL